MTGIEYFNIKKNDDNNISCIKEIPDHPKGIVIAIHGFTSSKESSTYRRLLDRLPAAGFGMVGIDLPGHGTGNRQKRRCVFREQLTALRRRRGMSYGNIRDMRYTISDQVLAHILSDCTSVPGSMSEGRRSGAVRL